MKKFKNIFALLVIALVGLSLTACSDDDNLNTNQYGGDITLTAFGPCPVLRGGTLYLQGKNLDQIVEIDLPGSDPITAIEVLEKGTHSRIAIQVPAEGGEVGPITLKTAKGGTIVSTSSITFREDIRIDDVFIESEGNLTGSVGDVVTIKGDYLNLINAVIFTDKDTVEVDEFVSQDRYTIQVPINKFAQSGTLILTDLAETPTEIQTEQAIVVNLPEAAVISPATVKAGQTVTVTGVGMDQIESVVLQGVIVPAEDITLSDDGNSIIFTLPETAQDGEVTLVTYSGVKVPAGSITTVAPSNLAVVGTPKNGLKMEITGQDLELVKTVALEKAGVVDADKVTITSSKITISEVPEAAQDGNATLTMANGKQVTVAYTLVKPTVTESDPAEFVAGEEILLYGTDLDLVASITFPGDGTLVVASADFAAQEEEGIQVTTPAAAFGSGLVLTMKNGQTVEVPGIFNIKAASDPAISECPEGAVVGEEVTIKGKNFNNLANIYIGDYKVTKYVSKSNTEITFKVPANAEIGSYKIVMEDYDGKKYEGPSFNVVPAETTIWEGYVGPPNWDGNKTITFTSDMLTAMSNAETVGIEFEIEGGWGQMEICGSWWTQLQGPKDAWVAMGNSLNDEGRAIMDFSTSGTFEFPAYSADAAILQNQGAILFVGGGGLYVTRIYVK